MATKTTTIPPNQTLYVRNLPDKLPKPDLKRHLYMLFSTYGPVLDINAAKDMKRRGQAYITFRDQNAAIMAMRACNDTEFFEKKMSIQYAKSKSHALAKLDGSFVMGGAARKAEESELQKSIFDAPGRSNGDDDKIVPEPKKAAIQAPLTSAGDAVDIPHGVKRPRDDAEEEEDVAMEEDDGSDMDMDESD